jgi:acetyltransferase-like isoleucine patch superfamily enzyme
MNLRILLASLLHTRTIVNLRIMVESLLRARCIPLGRVEIGEYTTGIPLVLSRATNLVRIGKFCSIAPEVTIIPALGHVPTYAEDRHYRISTYPIAMLRNNWNPKWDLPGDKNFVIVRNDVWIGTKAVLLPGVRIGDGAIIGAGAVVTHDIPPYAIATGIPAKVKGFRYSPAQIEKLLRIAWWNWELNKIEENIDFFYGDIDAFLKKFSEE